MAPTPKAKNKNNSKSKRLLFDKPPSAESSETEEQHEEVQTPLVVIKPIEEDKQQQLESGEEEDEPEQEDEQPKKTKKKRPDTHSGSESSTDSHPASKKPKKVMSPIVKESAKAAKPNKTDEEKSVSLHAKTTTTTTTTTDAVEEDEDDLEEKKGSIVRLWSFNDELVILQAMIDFKEQNNQDPASNRDDFFNFVKLKLNDRKFTKVQLMDKLRRLKKKYKTNLNKSSASGEDPIFSNPHDLKSYQLSKRIWNYTINNSNAKVDGAVVEDDMMKVDEEEKKGMVEKGVLKKAEDGEKVYPYLIKAFEGETLPKVLMLDGFKTCLSNVDSVLLKEWDSKWKKVYIAETDAYISRLALIQEQTNWFYNQIKSSKD